MEITCKHFETTSDWFYDFKVILKWLDSNFEVILKQFLSILKVIKKQLQKAVPKGNCKWMQIAKRDCKWIMIAKSDCKKRLKMIADYKMWLQKAIANDSKKGLQKSGFKNLCISKSD